MQAPHFCKWRALHQVREIFGFEVSKHLSFSVS
jgi:hypothetical protein